MSVRFLPSSFCSSQRRIDPGRSFAIGSATRVFQHHVEASVELNRIAATPAILDHDAVVEIEPIHGPEQEPETLARTADKNVVAHADSAGSLAG